MWHDKNTQPISNIIETINNKPTEGSNKTDPVINNIAYDGKSLGNGSKENHQTHITKQVCDNTTLLQKDGCIEKPKHPSHLNACREKHQQRVLKT